MAQNLYTFKEELTKLREMTKVDDFHEISISELTKLLKNLPGELMVDALESNTLSVATLSTFTTNQWIAAYTEPRFFFKSIYNSLEKYMATSTSTSALISATAIDTATA